jgi:hypothetical protein
LKEQGLHLTAPRVARAYVVSIEGSGALVSEIIGAPFLF